MSGAAYSMRRNHGLWPGPKVCNETSKPTKIDFFYNFHEPPTICSVDIVIFIDQNIAIISIQNSFKIYTNTH